MGSISYSKRGIGGATVEHLAEILCDVGKSFDVLLDCFVLGDWSEGSHALFNGVK